MLKRLLYCVLLLFVLSYTCFSRDKLTDDQFQEIKTSLTNSKIQLDQQAVSIAHLKEIQKQDKILQATLDRIIQTQEKELTTLSESLKKQKSQTILDKIYNFFIGVLFGSCAVTIVYLINL